MVSVNGRPDVVLMDAALSERSRRAEGRQERYRTIFRVDGRVVWIVRVVHGTQLLDTAVLEE